MSIFITFIPMRKHNLKLDYIVCWQTKETVFTIYYQIESSTHHYFPHLQLVKKSDIVLENYIPGKMDSMGLGYEALRKIAPSIIYCSISGNIIKLTYI